MARQGVVLALFGTSCQLDSKIFMVMKMAALMDSLGWLAPGFKRGLLHQAL